MMMKAVSLHRKILSLIVLAMLVLVIVPFTSGVARAAISLDSGSEATYTTSASPSSFSMSATLANSGELVVATIAFESSLTSANLGNDYGLFTLKANGNTMTWVAGDGGSNAHSTKSGTQYTNFGEDTWIYNASSLASGSYTVSVSVSTYTGWSMKAGIYAYSGVDLSNTVGTIGSDFVNPNTVINFDYSPTSQAGTIIWTGGAFSSSTMSWDSPITSIQSVSGTNAVLNDGNGPVQSYSSEATIGGGEIAAVTGIQIFAIALTYSMTLSNGLSYFSVSFPTGRGTNIQSAPGQSSTVAGISISLTSGDGVSVTLALNRTLPSDMNIQYSTTATEPASGSDYLTTSAVTVYSGVNAPSTMNIWLWFIVNNQYVGTTTLNETVGILVTVSD